MSKTGFYGGAAEILAFVEEFSIPVTVVKKQGLNLAIQRRYEVNERDAKANTPDLESRLEKLDWVLSKLGNANLTIHQEKVNILKPTLAFLRHTLCEKRITISTAKRENLRDFPTPITTFKVQSFSGLANFFTKCCKTFSKEARPLTDLMSKNVTFIC